MSAPSTLRILVERFLLLCYRQHRLFFACLVAGIVIGLLFYAFSPTVYRARGNFLIDQLPFGTPPEEEQSQVSDAETSRVLIQSLILSIPSREMRRAVAESLGVPASSLAFIDRDRPVFLDDGLKRANITVVATRNSRLGSITVESSNSKFAAEVINAIFSEMENINRVAGRLIQLDSQVKLLRTEADDLAQQFTVTSSDRIKVEKQKQELDQYLAAGNPVESFPAFSDDATLNNLKTQLILVQSEYDAVASGATRGTRLTGKKAELESLQNQVRIHSADLAAALRSSVEIYQRRQEGLRSDLDNLQKRIDGLTTQRARLAKAIGDFQLRNEVLAEKTESGIDNQASVIVIVDPGRTERHKIRPLFTLNLLLGAFFGAGVGLSAGLFRQQLDYRLRSPQRIESISGVPCLAVFLAESRPSGSLLNEPAHSITGAAVGFLRRYLLHSSEQDGVPPVYSFACLDKEADTASLVVRLAILLSMGEKRVLIVDLDFIESRVPGLLGIRSVGNGLAEWLSTGGPLFERIIPTSIPNLSLLPASELRQGVDDLLVRRPLGKELLAMTEAWDFILLNGPPILDPWRILRAAPLHSTIIAVGSYENSSIEDIEALSLRATEFDFRLGGFVLQGFPPEKLRNSPEVLGLGRHLYVFGDIQASKASAPWSRRISSAIRRLITPKPTSAGKV